MKYTLIAIVCILLIASCNKDDGGGSVCYFANTHYVFAQGGAKFILPTAFTPNGDGRNDVFRPIGVAGLTNFSLTVFDNVGNTIFRTIDMYTTGWDGRSNSGAPLPEGKYAVHFQFNTLNGDVADKNICIALLSYGAGNCIPRSGIDNYIFEDQIDPSTGYAPYGTAEIFCP